MRMTRYTGDTSGNGPSYNVWHDCPWSEALEDPNIGYGYYDEFHTYDSTATTVRNASGTPTFEGSAQIRGTAGTTAATAGGLLEIFNTADGDEAALEVGGAANGPYMISTTAGDAKKLWFECRIKNSLIDDLSNWFVGLAAPGSGVASFHNTAGTDYADVSFIGFTQHEDDGDSIDFTYQANGQAFSNLFVADVPVADTFAKLGFVYDPKAVAAERIAIYVDNVKQSTFVTNTLITTNTFPEAEGLGPLIATESSTTNDRTLTMDWWRVFQER